MRFRIQDPPFGSIMRGASLPAKWWKQLSEHSRSDRPHHEFFFHHYTERFAYAYLHEVEGEPFPDDYEPAPSLPSDLDDVEPSLPPITRDEALAILARFLLLERKDIVGGVEIQILQWLVLTGFYCPSRERYQALRDMANLEWIRPAPNGVLYSPSDLRWPLVITAVGAREIEDVARVRRYVPTFSAAGRRLGVWFRHFPILGRIVGKATKGTI